MSRSALLLCALFAAGAWLQDGPHQTRVAQASVRRRRALSAAKRFAASSVMRGDDPAAKWPSFIHVIAIPITGDAAAAGVTSEGAPNGEFVLRDAFGPRSSAQGYTRERGVRWSFAAVLLDGVDVTDVPTDFSAKPDATLEVVFTQNPAVIDGTVTTAAGEPAAVAWVVVLSANAALWPTTTEKFPGGP